jgi:hypothetical protein
MSVKKDKKRKEFEVWANKEMKKIQEILLMADFDVDKIQPAEHPDTSTSQFCFPYKNVTIKYSESIFDFWKEGDKRSAWSVLLHEMIHPLTDKLYSVGTDRFISRGQIETDRPFCKRDNQTDL